MKVTPEAVILTFESGNGYFPESAKLTDNHLDILFISDNLAESRAEDDCDEKLKKAIVARIARITITTMSSTRVKPKVVFGFWFLVFGRAKFICRVFIILK
jgi:hypothetical protein